MYKLNKTIAAGLTALAMTTAAYAGTKPDKKKQSIQAVVEDTKEVLEQWAGPAYEKPTPIQDGSMHLQYKTIKTTGKDGTTFETRLDAFQIVTDPNNGENYSPRYLSCFSSTKGTSWRNIESAEGAYLLPVENMSRIPSAVETCDYFMNIAKTAYANRDQNKTPEFNQIVSKDHSVVKAQIKRGQELAEEAHKRTKEDIKRGEEATERNYKEFQAMLKRAEEQRQAERDAERKKLEDKVKSFR